MPWEPDTTKADTTLNYRKAMSTLDGPRKLVKATYAHKRNRTSKNQAQMNPLSSPLEILGDQEEVNLTRTEMMRRMLKRSRHAGQSTTYDEDQDSNQTQVLERRIKRTKRSTRPNAATQNEFSMSLNDIDSTEDSLFQTPYEEGYVYPSLILKPLVPEQMSPVPIANRILSRTTSRRLKENSATSRTTSSRGGLASPFASRHNSVNSSPGSKSRPKSNLRANRHSKSRTTRPALSTKSRSIASSLNDNSAFGANSQVLQHESVFTMNHSSHPSPLRPGQNPNPITRNRYPSSHTLTQIPQQDWLVPAKALTRTRTPDDLDMHTPPDFGIIIEKSEVGDSSFLADLPMAFSTPLPTRSSHLTSDIRVYAPGSGLYASSRSGSSTNAIIDELQPYYGSGGFDPAGNERDIYDVAMNDVLSSSRPRKPLHISGNSIISSSGDFTLGPSDYSSPSCAAAGSAIVHDDEDNRNEDTDETDSLFPTHDDAMQKERSPTTHLSILQPKQSLLVHEIAMYPTTSSPALNLAVPRSRSVPFIDELMASEVPAHTSTSFPEPLSMAEMDVEIESAESALRAMFDDMGLANEAGSYFAFVCVCDVYSLFL